MYILGLEYIICCCRRDLSDMLENRSNKIEIDLDHLCQAQDYSGVFMGLFNHVFTIITFQTDIYRYYIEIHLHVNCSLYVTLVFSG